MVYWWVYMKIKIVNDELDYVGGRWLFDILNTIPNNTHYLNRYIRFIYYCVNYNKCNFGYELHHICPKSKNMFPEYTDLKINPWNGVELSLRQHFIAHHILWKAYGGDMTIAFKGMNNFGRYENKLNSKTYQLLVGQGRRTQSRKMKIYYENNPWRIEEIRISRTAENNPLFGKPISEAHKQKLLDGGNLWRANPENVIKFKMEARKRYSIPTNCSFYGKKHSDETRKIQSENHSGVNNPFYGKSHSEETKNLISEKAKCEGNGMFGKIGAENPNYGQKRSKEYKDNITGRKNPRAKSVEINNTLYGCIKDAAKRLNLCYSSLSQNLKYNDTRRLEKMGIYQFKLFAN